VNVAGLIFDFDGVLLESEYAGNAHLAELLTALGHPTSIDESMNRFMGLAGAQFRAAVEAWIGGPIPAAFDTLRAEEDARAVTEGIAEVAGAVRFVRSLPRDLPRAVASSSSTAWLYGHLANLGIADAFGVHVYSGREHVANGKPHPDLYWYAAQAIGVAIGECAIIEDSPVGVTGALNSGARVIGLVAGTHCAPDHADRLRALGVTEIARDFDAVARLLDL